MTAPTSPWNIPLFGTGDTIGPLASVFNSQSNALNSALNSLQANAYGQYTTYAALTAVTGTANGQHATVTNDPNVANNGDYQWNLAASQWVQNPRSGLIPILPGSVASATGVTLGANGVVTLNGASAVSINSAFATKYDDYVIVANVSFSTASLLQVNLRSAGTDNTSTNYAYQALQGSGSSASAAAAVSQTQHFFTNTAAITADCRADLFGPALAVNTRYSSQFYVNGTSQAIGTIGGIHAVAAAFDGLTIKPATAGAIFTGTIRIYAQNNN